MLGWIIDSVNLKITLLPHCLVRLKEIVSSIPYTQHRVGVDKWHRVLGKLRSMALTLPRAGDCLAKCRKPFTTSKEKGSHCPQAYMKPCQTSNGWTWQIDLHACTSSSRSDQLWTATMMPPNTCGGAWYYQYQPPYLINCRHRLALRGPP